jgi:hypothetical protein
MLHKVGKREDRPNAKLRHRGMHEHVVRLLRRQSGKAINQVSTNFLSQTNWGDDANRGHIVVADDGCKEAR